MTTVASPYPDMVALHIRKVRFCAGTSVGTSGIVGIVGSYYDLDTGLVTQLHALGL